MEAKVDKNVSDEEWEARDFAPAERRHIRQTMKDFERYRWLLKILSAIAIGGATAVGVVWTGREQIARLLRSWILKG